MITMSKPKTARAAKNYFATEYEHPRGSYYTTEERIVGKWGGNLASEFGLSGNITKDTFTRLANGQNPHTCERLIRQKKRHERESVNGKIRKTIGHRAGVDIINSASKSVSLACIVGGDERIRDAHREANRASMREVESRVKARLGGNKEPVTTGRAVIATFEHDAARPDRKKHYAAPDLHSHNFVFNIARTADGKFRAIDMRNLYEAQKLGTTVYRAKLAEEVRKLGYEIRVNKRTAAPEIKGISRQYIKANSPRKTEIEEKSEQWRAEGRPGMVRPDGSTSTRSAATHKRRSKVFDREKMKLRHQELEKEFGGQAHKAAQDARLRAQGVDISLLHDADESRVRASEAVTHAIAHFSEGEAVNKADLLLREALRRGVGAATLEDVKGEIERRQERGELISITEEDAARRREIAEKRLATERANIEIMRAGQGTQQPISEFLPEERATSQDTPLNENQRAAVEQIVTSHDRVHGVQSGAGKGKRAVLAAVRREAERAGYKVQGFATTKRGVEILAQSGIESKTVRKYIRERQDPETEASATGRRLLVLDGSSSLSTRQMNAFLSQANPEDRILLVGGVRRHEAVEADDQFAKLREHGMQTTRLGRVVSGIEEPLRRMAGKRAIEVVESIANDAQKQVHVSEVVDGQTRLQAMAREYAVQPDGALVISSTSGERETLNRLIREECRAKNHIGETEHTMQILRERSELAGAERTSADSYRPGDIVRFNRSSKICDVKAGEYARVVNINRDSNLITVKFESEGEEQSEQRMKYDPKRLQGVSVYEETQIKVAEVERLQVCAPMRKLRIAKGELGTIEKIETDNLTVKFDSGRKISFPVSDRLHLDYGYAVTSHPSQNQSIKRVLINADTSESDAILDKQIANVAASRTHAEIKIYTDSAEKIGAILARQVNNPIAPDATRHPSQSPPAQEEAPRSRSIVRAEHEESRIAGATITQSLSAFDHNRITNIFNRNSAPMSRAPVPAQQASETTTHSDTVVKDEAMINRPAGELLATTHRPNPQTVRSEEDVTEVVVSGDGTLTTTTQESASRITHDEQQFTGLTEADLEHLLPPVDAPLRPVAPPTSPNAINVANFLAEQDETKRRYEMHDLANLNREQYNKRYEQLKTDAQRQTQEQTRTSSNTSRQTIEDSLMTFDELMNQYEQALLTGQTHLIDSENSALVIREELSESQETQDLTQDIDFSL